MAEATDPVPVGRFEWERLMMVSPLPWATRSILLALAIFMSEDGSNARPGLDAMVKLTRGRSVVIEHLAAAVDAGYLVVVERGGYRKGTARATKYAATVPAEVYRQRRELLASPPWRRAESTPPTSGAPDLRTDDASHERPARRTLVNHEGPEGRTLVNHEGPVSTDEGPVLPPRTSGQPDPIMLLHHAEITTSLRARDSDDDEIGSTMSAHTGWSPATVRAIRSAIRVRLGDDAERLWPHFAAWLTTEQQRRAASGGPIRTPVAYVRSMSADDIRGHAIDEQTRQRAEQEPHGRDARPRWCGECDPDNRMRTEHGTNSHDDRAYRCPKCHPLNGRTAS